MITKYTYGREWEEARVVELTFELIDGRLVAPVGHRKRTRKYLHGHYHTSVDDCRLYDSLNQCIDAYVTTLKMTIAPTLRKIANLEAQRTGGIDLSAYTQRLEELHTAEHAHQQCLCTSQPAAASSPHS